MLTELPELKEEEKMMEKIQIKLNVQLIRLREEELALKRLIREQSTDSTSIGIMEDDALHNKESIPVHSSISQHVARLPKLTDEIPNDRLAAGELAVNQVPLSDLGSSLMPDDDAFSEEEEEDDEDQSSQSLMEIWKSMGHT